MTAARVPLLLGHGEIAAIYGVKVQTSQAWRSNGVLAEPDLILSGNPYWLLATVMRLDGHDGRAVSPTRLQAYCVAHPNGYDVPSAVDLPVLVGIQEIARLCRVDDQTVSRWRNRRTIADHDLYLSRSPIWLLDTVLRDAEKRGRSLDPEYLIRLQSGEQSAQKPRGRSAEPTSSARRKLQPLPGARTFGPGDDAAATAFVEGLLAEGYSITVRPRR